MADLLVVENDARLAGLLAFFLERGGHRVRAAASFAEAREKLRERRPDLLLSGTRAGRTLGSPIALRIANRDATIEDLPVPTNPRPGHADLAGCQKLGERDPRAVMERASARETAARVALGGMSLSASFDEVTWSEAG